MKKAWLRIFGIAAPALVALALALSACSNPAGDTGAKDVVAPPEMLVGTIAFSDAAATMTLHFNQAKALSARASYSVTGTIRYLATDFAVTGSYDSASGALSLTTAEVLVTSNGKTYKFSISGTYTAAGGFTGVVERTVNSTVDAATGNASACSTTEATSSTVLNYLGVFGGSAVGTWNMTINGSTVAGSYSGTSGGGAVSGSISGTKSGLTITITSVSGLSQGSAHGTIENGGVGGTWTGTTVIGVGQTMPVSGSWSGHVVTAAGDPYSPTGSESDFYKFSVAGNLIRSALMSVDVTGLGGFTNAAHTVSATASGSQVVYTISNYTDNLSGLSIASGTVTYDYDVSTGTAVLKTMTSNALVFTPTTLLSTLQFTFDYTGASPACTLLKVDGAAILTSYATPYL